MVRQGTQYTRILNMRLVILLLIICGITACKPVTNTKPSDTTLILRAELREISADLIREFRFFDTGLVEETVIYSGAKKPALFSTNFYQLGDLQLKNLIKQIQELSSKSYENQFPWKEDFYKRGDVLKLEYAMADRLPHSTYYYTGHEDSPEIFKSLFELINSNSNQTSLLK